MRFHESHGYELVVNDMRKEAAQEYLDFNNLREFAHRDPPDVATLPMASPSSVDFNWAIYYASGDSAVLRVNAAGVLAKTPDLDVAGRAVRSLVHDAPVRARYLHAVGARIGASVRAISAELASPRDAGARWCSAWLLGQQESPAARYALSRALRTEPVTENIRTIGLLLNGDDPCT